MWKLVDSLRDNGVTILLTTHYIEEAEEMADRIGIILGGGFVLVEEKHELMRKLGKKQLTVQLEHPLADVPPALAPFSRTRGRRRRARSHVRLAARRREHREADQRARLGRHRLPRPAHDAVSLEDIFVSLIDNRRNGVQGA